MTIVIDKETNMKYTPFYNSCTTTFIVGDKIINVNLNLNEETFNNIKDNKEIYDIINLIKNNILIENEKLIISYGIDVSIELKKITSKVLNSLSKLKDIDFFLHNLNNKKHDKILGELELIQFTLLTNNRLLNELNTTNKESYLKLFLYIEAGKSKIADLQLNNNKINENFKELELLNKIKLFEKQLEDLKLQQMLSLNNQVQIDDLENTNKQLINKINELKKRFK